MIDLESNIEELVGDKTDIIYEPKISDPEKFNGEVINYK